MNVEYKSGKVGQFKKGEIPRIQISEAEQFAILKCIPAVADYCMG